MIKEESRFIKMERVPFHFSTSTPNAASGLGMCKPTPVLPHREDGRGSGQDKNHKHRLTRTHTHSWLLRGNRNDAIVTITIKI